VSQPCLVFRHDPRIRKEEGEVSIEAFSGQVKFTPWWWEAAPPRPKQASSLPESADVAVVGAGFTGLTAALTLARAGRHVVVIDAEAPGHGASTRNGGQCGSGNQKFTAAQLIANHGEKIARELVSEGLAMLRHLGEFIEREGIDCHFSRVGRFRGAVVPRHYERLARDMDDMHKLAGVESHMVTRAEQHAEVGSDFYHGGAVLPNDGSLHPALYHKGLLERVEEAGVEVIGHTPVDAVRPERGEVVLSTRHGRLRARCALIATNGYTGSATPQFTRRIIPIGSAIIATEVLDPALTRRLMPKNRVVGAFCGAEGSRAPAYPMTRRVSCICIATCFGSFPSSRARASRTAGPAMWATPMTFFHTWVTTIASTTPWATAAAGWCAPPGSVTRSP
jgi:glycine/D-amino acid oxidase-like deaminating enzyme